MFDTNSRYASSRVKTLQLTLPDGTTVAYVDKRSIPAPGEIKIRAQMDSLAGERIDRFSARALGDPSIFWRLYDANLVPDPLTIKFDQSRRWRVPVPID